MTRSLRPPYCLRDADTTYVINGAPADPGDVVCTISDRNLWFSLTAGFNDGQISFFANVAEWPGYGRDDTARILTGHETDWVSGEWDGTTANLDGGFTVTASDGRLAGSGTAGEVDAEFDLACPGLEPGLITDANVLPPAVDPCALFTADEINQMMSLDDNAADGVAGSFPVADTSGAFVECHWRVHESQSGSGARVVWYPAAAAAGEDVMKYADGNGESIAGGGSYWLVESFSDQDFFGHHAITFPVGDGVLEVVVEDDAGKDEAVAFAEEAKNRAEAG